MLNRVDRAAFFGQSRPPARCSISTSRSCTPSTRTAQATGRVVHAAGNRPLHGGAGGHGAARGTGYRRRIGRSECASCSIPCCGTGAYLTEVLRHIKARLDEQGLGDAAGARLKQAALARVFGFELLPAPYVVAHLQLGLLLHQWGAALDLMRRPAKRERLGVYLTNALTGWQPPDEDGKKRMAQLALNFPELMAENNAARAVKQERRILVIRVIRRTTVSPG